MNRLKFYWHRVWRNLLRMIFHFDKWHIAPLSAKSYARQIIDYLNRKNGRNSIAEIGCGLGDIIRRTRYNHRFGYDSEPNVLKAASFLSYLNFQGDAIQYHQFNFPEMELGGKHDAIVLVNWIHHIQPEILREQIHHYFSVNLDQNGMIILDTVSDEAYKYNHDIGHLTGGLPCGVECLGSFERGRKLWAIKKNN